MIHLRSQLATKRAALLVMLCFLLAGYWLWVGIDGFVLLAQDANGPSVSVNETGGSATWCLDE
ncbi:hypothetical protein ACLB1M_09870 [Escherichia coli]